jgi:hypothetical protein
MQGSTGDLDAALAESRSALEQLIVAGERSGVKWAEPRAPGKWSPSQIVEHVARALEESGKNIKGEKSAFPSLPRMFRPAVRRMFFNRILKKNAFTNSRTTQGMNPLFGPVTPSLGKERLMQAHDAFDRACRMAAPRFNHSIFGDISTADYARFQALHTLHHMRQIPWA